MNAEELASVLAHATHGAQDLASLAVEEPYVVVGEIGNIQELLVFIVREHYAAGRATNARPFGHLDFLLEIALLVGDVNPVAGPVGGVDQPVVREIKSKVADELLGHRTVRCVGVVGRLGAYFRKFVSVGAPTPLELERV